MISNSKFSFAITSVKLINGIFLNYSFALAGYFAYLKTRQFKSITQYLAYQKPPLTMRKYYFILPLESIFCNNPAVSFSPAYTITILGMLAIVNSTKRCLFGTSLFKDLPYLYRWIRYWYFGLETASFALVFKLPLYASSRNLFSSYLSDFALF